MEPTAHAIFGDLPPEQQCLVDIIGRQANAGGKWPSFDFIDRTFRQQTGGDTLATMNALPAVRPGSGPARAARTAGERGEPARPQPSSVPPSTLRLTPLTAGLRSRNATASTMSAIWASRPHGVRATTPLRSRSRQ